MNEIAKRAAIERLKKAMEMEKLQTGDTARYLNINPCYLSMALNEKFWASMSKGSWDRIIDWCNSGATLSHFKKPEGEPVFLSKKDQQARIITDLENKVKKEKIIEEIKEISLTPEAATKLLKARTDIREPGPGKNIAPVVLAENKIEPKPEQYFTDAVRLKVALDIEINLVVNGQKVHL